MLQKITDGETLLKRAKVTECSVYFTKQKHQKAKTWHDGTLKFYHFNKKIRLFDETDSLLAEEFIQKENQIQLNNVITLNSYLVEIAEILNSFDRDLSGTFPSKIKKNKQVSLGSDDTASKNDSFSRYNANSTTAIKHEMKNPTEFNPKCLTTIKASLNSIQSKLERIKKEKVFNTNLDSFNFSDFKKQHIPIKYAPVKAHARNVNALKSPSQNFFKPPVFNKNMISSPASKLLNVLEVPCLTKKSDEKVSSDNVSIVDAPLINKSNPSNSNLSISDKYHLKKKSFFSKRRKSVLLVGLPSNDLTDYNNYPNANCRRKRKQSLTKIMKLSGPRRPIEIPKEFLDNQNGSNSNTRSDGNESTHQIEPNISSSHCTSSPRIASLFENDSMNLERNKSNNSKIKDENKDENLKTSFDIISKLGSQKPKMETADEISFESLRNFNGENFVTGSSSVTNNKSTNLIGNDILFLKIENDKINSNQKSNNNKRFESSLIAQQITPPRSSAEKFQRDISIVPNKTIDNTVKHKINLNTSCDSSSKPYHTCETMLSNFSDEDFVNDDDNEERDESLNSIMKRINDETKYSKSESENQSSKKVDNSLTRKTRLNNLSEFIGHLNEKERQEEIEEIENESSTQTKTYNFTKNIKNSTTNDANERAKMTNNRDSNTEQRSFLTVSKKMLSASIKNPNTATNF